MNRYEEIFMRLVAAEVGRTRAEPNTPMDADEAADSVRYYAAAASKIEAHFKERDAVELERTWGGDVPALLRRQAE